ncbi:MAG: 4-hydroxy-tetrahydrodipicolinate synthase [Burkholderiales bacterium]
MIELKKDFLRGSVPPMMTPFKDGKIDFESFARLVEFQVASGTHGILVNGTTSEPSTLTTEERNLLVRTAIEVVGKRIPVVAATGSQSFDETVQLTEYAAKAGADALLVVTPYYIRPPQRGVVQYFVELGKRVDTPLLMYHIPGRSAFKVELATLTEIAAKVPSFVGIKHAVDDHSFVSEMVQTFGPDFRIFCGLEEFTFSMMAIGAAGTMNAVANIAPKPVAQLCEALIRGDLAEARRLHYQTFELMRAVFFDTNPIPLKYMAKRLGLLPNNEHRLPMMPATPALELCLDEVLAGAGLI